ncbi:MAG: apolipoprotein N-acyltransferase [bacterium]
MKFHNLPLYQIFLALLSGILLTLAFPCFHLSILAWVGLIPLFFALRKASARLSFGLGWICGLSYFGGTLYWIMATMILYGHLAVWQSALIALALVGYLSLFIGGFASLLSWFRSHASLPGSLTAPLIWVSMELLRTHLFTGFPWSSLGYTQYRNIRLIQMADLAGVYGISFLIVFVNACLSTILERLPVGKDNRPSIRFSPVAVPALALVLIIGLVEGYGACKLSFRPIQSAGTLSLGLIQGNILQEEKWDIRLQDKIEAVYQSLTLEAARQKPDLIIWPEASTPFFNEQQGEYLANISSVARKAGVPLLVGSPRLEMAGNSRGKDSQETVLLKNSAFFLSPEGKILDYYDKIHLVPFGEYLPLRSLCTLLGSVVNEVGEFSPGQRFTAFELDRRRFGLVICYEIIFPALFRRFMRQGVHFMINITNDAWFGRSSAPYQHFSMAVFRAVENGRSIVRVANTGISGIIDPMGRIAARTQLFERTALVRNLELQTVDTLYTKVGDVFAKACLMILCLLMLSGLYHVSGNGG